MSRAIDDWDWPKWLTCEWIARDQSGIWCGYLTEPFICGLSWHVREARYVRFTSWAFALNLPDSAWQESKRRNPHRSKAE